MFKGLLIAAIAFAPAAFAFDDAVCLVPVDTTAAKPTLMTHIPMSTGHRDVIYDEQTYSYSDLV
jgi:hypothetical protein